MVGYKNFLISFNIEDKAQLILIFLFSDFNWIELRLDILSLKVCPFSFFATGYTYSIILFELFLLSQPNKDTFTKYCRIFILSITSGIEIVLFEWIAKWKKVFDDCLLEYWLFIGSRAGVIISFFPTICAFSMLPESKSELTFILVSLRNRITWICRFCIFKYYKLI